MNRIFQETDPATIAALANAIGADNAAQAAAAGGNSPLAQGLQAFVDRERGPRKLNLSDADVLRIKKRLAESKSKPKPKSKSPRKGRKLTTEQIENLVVGGMIAREGRKSFKQALWPSYKPNAIRNIQVKNMASGPAKNAAIRRLYGGSPLYPAKGLRNLLLTNAQLKKKRGDPVGWLQAFSQKEQIRNAAGCLKAIKLGQQLGKFLSPSTRQKGLTPGRAYSISQALLANNRKSGKPMSIKMKDKLKELKEMAATYRPKSERGSAIEYEIDE